MKRITFAISSLAAAGFTAPDAAHSALVRVTSGGFGSPHQQTLFEVFTQSHTFRMGDHRSHSSHSSHRSSYGGSGHYSHTSHTSHRSSYGGYDDSPGGVTYSPPKPVPVPTPQTQDAAAPAATPQTLFTAEQRAAPPKTDPSLPALSGRTQRFKAIVTRVQIALLAQGYYNGALDGTVGPQLRSALRAFQKTRQLDQTGTVTPQTLDALMIATSSP